MTQKKKKMEKKKKKQKVTISHGDSHLQQGDGWGGTERADPVFPVHCVADSTLAEISILIQDDRGDDVKTTKTEKYSQLNLSLALFFHCHAVLLILNLPQPSRFLGSLLTSQQ